MYGCESWSIKAERRRTDAFELWYWRRLKSPMDCKEIKPANPKGNQSWIFVGRTDAAAEAPILMPPDAKSQLIGKDSEAGGWSLTRWTWVWVNSGRWWWTGRPGVLRFMGSQTRLTELNWVHVIYNTIYSIYYTVWEEISENKVNPVRGWIKQSENI